MRSGEIQLNGKLFVSSRRAAEIAGYATDYIGQLCRGGKLETTRLGRSWYVSLESLEQYQASLVEAGPVTPADPIEKKVESSSVTENHAYESKGVHRPEIVYSADTRSLIPQLSKKVDLSHIPEVLSATTSTGANLSSGDTVPVESSVFSALSQKLKQRIESVSAGVVSVEDSHTLETSATTRTSNNSFMFAGFSLAVAGVFALIVFVSSHITSITEVTAQAGAVLTEKDSAHAGVIVEKITDAVSPESRIADIENSFSDEVSVVRDASGSSGVITPVFRNGRSGDDFLFVMVPVEQTE